MDSRPVRIYADSDAPRLRYIAGIILGDILGLQWEVVTDKRKLGKFNVINYSDEKISGSFMITPDSLLFEKDVVSREIRVDKWKDLPVFFMTSSESDIPFDIFAASFYLVARYEEYLEYQPDEYGRFRASSSLAFKNGFLEIPVVDMWAREFAKLLLKRFQTLAFRRNEYKAIVTFDTDEPFEYLGKGIFRSIGGMLRDLTINEGHAAERYKTLAKGEPDPFEVFGFINDCIDRNLADARFFFPVGDRSKFDHNPSWKNEEYRSLILRLAERHSNGLHPSFYASDNPSLMNREVARLKAILGSDIRLSRFHYIRLMIPQSYRMILKEGIKEDHSMGYPDEPGFRAGIARPFYFYDIKEDLQTGLIIVPFQVMDITLYRYKKLDPGSSKEIIQRLISATRGAGGQFVSIWHNTSLLDNQEWKEWREVFEFTLKTQAK